MELEGAVLGAGQAVAGEAGRAVKPTRAEESYFDPDPDLFMLTSRELAEWLPRTGCYPRRAP